MAGPRRTILIFMLTALAAAAASGQTIRIVASDSSEPFVPLVTSVVRHAGLTPEITVVPQARMIGTLRDFDAAFFVTDFAIAQTPGMSKIPIPLAQDELVAITVDPGLRVSRLEDLRGYRVGIMRGSMVSERAAEGLPDVIKADNLVTLLKMLNAKRFDVALVHRELAKISADSANVGQYYVHEPPLLSVPFYFALSETGSAYASRLTKAFQDAVGDGSWERELDAVTDRLNR